VGDVSIYDVAQVAGVHSSTVSRAFSRPEAVNAVTRERILRLAGEMGYRVNPLGQALRRGASNLVPLIVPDITNPFYGELAKAISAAAGPRGYEVVLCVTESVAGQTRRYLASMEALFSPFAIVAPSTRIDPEALGRSALARRMIVIDRVPAELEVSSVFIDNKLGIRLAFEHLYGLGHRLIAYLTGTVGTFSAQERLEAYRALARAAGIEPVVLAGGYDPATSRKAAVGFADLSSRPSAVIASNDLAAFGFIAHVAQLGVRVPDDLSVTGFDGVAIGANFNPPLTTVAQPLADLGRFAVELAERFAATGVIEHIELVPELLVRGSTRSYA
jgi:DNA-binding LacI/PurR family transcriptional regulator